MKTINAQVRSNGRLADMLDDRRHSGIDTGAIKRQSRRQVRHRLDGELRAQMDQHFAEAKELIRYQRSINSQKPATHTSATIISFPFPEIRSGRVVQVVRKIGGDPYARKQFVVALLAAWSAVAGTVHAGKSALWLRGYRHGNTETKSDVLLDMPFEYYEGVAQGARDYGPEYDYYHHY